MSVDLSHTVSEIFGVK